MALYRQKAGVQQSALMHARKRQTAQTVKNDRASKVTSMIELFSENGGTETPKPTLGCSTLNNRCQKQEVVRNADRFKEKASPERIRRSSSGLSIELQTPKPFIPEKPPGLKPSPNKSGAPKNDMLLPKANGHIATEHIGSKVHLLINGTTTTNKESAPNQNKQASPKSKRVSRAFDYWEHKIEPKGPPPRSVSPNEISTSPTPRFGTKSFHSVNAPTSPKPFKIAADVKQPNTALKPSTSTSTSNSPTRFQFPEKAKPNVPPSSDKPNVKNNAVMVKNNIFIKQDKKPEIPTRPRFMTTAAGLRKPGPKPYASKENPRMAASVYSSPKKGGILSVSNAQDGPDTPPKIPPRDKPRHKNLTAEVDVPPALPERGVTNLTGVNPLPKPQRTFTFRAETEQRPSIAPRLPKRDLIRVSSDTSSLESRNSTLSSGSSFERKSNHFSTRIPDAGYEEVTLFQHPKAVNSQFRNTQRWERQHNYEDVDEEILKGPGSTNYDRITLDNRRRRSLEDGYEHLTLKQDPLRPYQVGNLKSSDSEKPNQHSKLQKQHSDMSDMMTRDRDISKSQLSLESSNRKLQITDKIRDAFSTIGKRYRHHKKGYNAVEDDVTYSTSGDEDSDTEMDLNKHKQTLERVRTLQKTYRKTLKYKSLEREMAIDCYKTKLFEQVLISKIVPDQDGKMVSKVVYRFPAPPPGKSMGDEKTLAHFCFPDINELAPCELMQSHGFSFMLTRENGTRKFGYCRRSLPPGTGPRYPVVYCLISALGSFGLYEKILEELDRRHHVSIKDATNFLDSLIVKNFPAPGRSITVDIVETEGKPSKFNLKRPFDTRLEHVDLQCLLYELGIENTIKIFASLLLERRVIIGGKSLGSLTACVHAFQALLYPFVWQHVFVPVLPMPMLDLCCTPTPLLIGILETSLEKLKTLPLEEVLIVNLSTKEVISCSGDEDEILPRKLQTALIEALKNHTGDWSLRDSGTQPSYNFATDYESAERNTVISESFMHLFVEMIGHYQNHFQPVDYNTTTPTRHGRILRSFDRTSFYDDVTSRSLRRFLDLFMETQMFDGFIHSREISGPDYEGLFERRISRHLLTADVSHLNFKVIKSKMKKFFNRTERKK